MATKRQNSFLTTGVSPKISYPKDKESEFEIQAFLFNELCALGYDVRGEVKQLDQQVRFDLVVFYNKKAVRIIEVKKNGQKKRNEENQIGKYACFCLPIDVIRGVKSARSYISFVKENGDFLF